MAPEQAYFTRVEPVSAFINLKIELIKFWGKDEKISAPGEPNGLARSGLSESTDRSALHLASTSPLSNAFQQASFVPKKSIKINFFVLILATFAAKN